eukprot:217674-Alexandrium_andersonii.AAC.1
MTGRPAHRHPPAAHRQARARCRSLARRARAKRIMRVAPWPTASRRKRPLRYKNGQGDLAGVRGEEAISHRSLRRF